MWPRAGIVALLFAFGFIVTIATGGPSPFSFALFPIPVAMAIVLRRFSFVHVLFATAALSGAVGVAAHARTVSDRDSILLMALTATFYIFVAFVGVPMGWGILSRWPYGRIVALVTAVVFAVVLPINIWGWETIQTECNAVLDRFDERLTTQADSTPPEALDAQRRVITWLREHNRDMFFGLVGFGTVLLGACITLSGVSAGLRHGFGEPGPTSSFAEMKPPDWLVWVVITAAACYFIEQRWANDWMRVVVWNTGFALGVVYWLNGLSVLAFALNTLQPNFVVFALGLVLIWVSGFYPIPCMLGLFDTWADFRSRATAFAEAIKSRSEDS